MKRVIPLILCLILMVSVLTTCAMKNTVPEETKPAPTETPVATAAPTPVPTPTAYAGPTNPLTGEQCEKDYTGIRPYAVMINNIEVATPQSGISQADIVYECNAEGGITRNMAIFQDIYDVGIVGSIRSARLYYVDIADSYDAIFIHAGGSPTGYDEISYTGIQDIDGVNGADDIFYRDEDRMDTMGYEHSLMFDSTLIHAFESDYGFDLNHRDSYVCNLTFTPDGTPVSGNAATKVVANFGSKDTSFEYSSSDKLYYAYEYGSPYSDEGNGAQLAFTNVFVLKTSVSVISDDEKGRVETVTTGSGSGYFFCGGKGEEITWSREEGGQFVYSRSDGSLLKLGVGKSYIGIVPDTESVDFS